MEKILDRKKAVHLSNELQKKGKAIILVGGCFDLIHIGHVSFLEKAKAQGNTLFVMLESDTAIKKMKGAHRPIHTQADRAKILASITYVDYVILLPDILSSSQYDTLIKSLKPAIIATTKGDPGRTHKERQAESINAKVIDVIDLIEDQSTSRLIKLLKKSDL